MSWIEAPEPDHVRCASTPAIETIIEARPRNIGGITVGRVLPWGHRRLVGPFAFFDHMGPTELAPGQGIDVRPHPHIGLSTVTYLFEGELLHRDSLGSEQLIQPGAINWMTAGRGIVHSERTPAQLRAAGSRLSGIQAWVALPHPHEEAAPRFDHHPADTLPQLEDGGVRLRVLAGSAFGATSPVQSLWPLFYVEAILTAGAQVPLPGEYPERAAYVVEGAVTCGAERTEARHMLVFAPGSTPRLRAESACRVMLLGGAAMDGPRHIWWNFVSSSMERIEQAKREWKEGRFPSVPGDEAEFVPAPER